MALSRDGKGFSLDSNFIDVVSDSYFVDKSLLIKDLIDSYPQHRSMLITRPRRFGKSLNLSMIKTFFEKTDEDTSVYFRDLKIWKCGDRYTSEQGKYPVIYLDLKDVLDKSWPDMYSGLKDIIAKEYKRHRYVMSFLEEEDVDKFKSIIGESADEACFAGSLGFLCEVLYTYYKVKPIILIDEYDVPIQQGYLKGYYDSVIDFMRVFLSSALKGIDLKMTFAVITGAMRVAKSSIFTGLNNLAVYSVTSNRYSEYFGFTKDEIGKILEDFGHPEKEKEICDWYDGYRFGDTEIFNPWSVSRYISEDFTPDTYWASSTSDSIVRQMLAVTTAEISEDILRVSMGKKISVQIDENVSYADLKNKPSNVFSMLLATGYLKAVSKKGDRYSLVVPNREIKKLFAKEIKDNVWANEGSDADRIKQALTDGDAERLERYLTDCMCREASFLETAYENSYQCIMVGLLFHMSDLYVFRTNGKAGYGLSDIELTPKNMKRGLPGIIIETERRRDEAELGKAAEDALAQIERMHYDANLVERGVERIDRYGIAFCGQKLIVRKAQPMGGSRTPQNIRDMP